MQRVVSAIPDADAQAYAGEKEEILGSVPFLWSYVLEFAGILVWVLLFVIVVFDFGWFFLVSAFLIPNTLWVTLSDCFSILPLATGAGFFIFSSEDLTLLSLNASFGLSALASLSSNLVCSSHFASKRHVNFLHLIIFVLSFASPFLATRVYLSLHLLLRIMFDFAHIPHFPLLFPVKHLSMPLMKEIV